MRITSVHFQNFKAFSDFSVSLEHVNLLVGPNNCGKSTILGAFRVLAAALRHARTRKPDLIDIGRRRRRGYRISEEVIPISLENVHTELSEQDSTVSFRVTGRHVLELLFPADGGCCLFAEADGVAPISAAGFKQAFPLQVEQVPVLGPLEHEEDIVEESTVRRALTTHRASRHFRNYWRYWPTDFDRFADLVQSTWPGMAVLPPERPSQVSQHLVMYCLENRITRELYWSGFGFQVWCQLLTHLTRSREASLVVVDEPEIYLHPDLQRQLLVLLRDLGPDVLLATHSSEIMADADPAEILLVDMEKRAASRLRDIEGVQAALKAVGSVQNITLTQLARTRRIVFVEGLQDFRLLRRFARRLGLSDLAAGAGVTPVESGGFSSWDEIRALAKGFETSLGEQLAVAAVFDHDYWPEEQVAKILKDLRRHIPFAHIHARKEIENYLLSPAVLDRALESAVRERTARTGESIEIEVSGSDILQEMTSRLKHRVLSRFVARRQDYLRHDRKDDATIAEETLEALEGRWSQLEARVGLVPGKEVLGAIRERAQELYKVNLTDYRLIDAYDPSEIPADLRECLLGLQAFSLGKLTGRDSS